MTVRWIGAVGLSGVLLACGCATKNKGQANGSTISVSSSAQAKYSDPLAASALREKALDALAALATDPSPQLRANALEAMEDWGVRDVAVFEGRERRTEPLG